MSKKKLLETLQQFFDSDQQERIKHSQQIKKVLKKLKEKERKKHIGFSKASNDSGLFYEILADENSK